MPKPITRVRQDVDDDTYFAACILDNPDAELVDVLWALEVLHGAH